MNDEERQGSLRPLLINVMDATQPHQGLLQCVPGADGHCITCSDEAVSATVVQIDEGNGTALVAVQVGQEAHEATEEIDITLVDAVVPGDIVLVHGGVAIALITEARNG